MAEACWQERSRILRALDNQLQIQRRETDHSGHHVFSGVDPVAVPGDQPAPPFVPFAEPTAPRRDARFELHVPKQPAASAACALGTEQPLAEHVACRWRVVKLPAPCAVGTESPFVPPAEHVGCRWHVVEQPAAYAAFSGHVPRTKPGTAGWSPICREVVLSPARADGSFTQDGGAGAGADGRADGLAHRRADARTDDGAHGGANAHAFRRADRSVHSQEGATPDPDPAKDCARF